MTVLAQRYAEALADVAIDRGIAEQVKKELAAFVNLMAESSELASFLANPAIARASKQAVIEKVVARLGATQALRNFLFVVVENRRSALLQQIQQAFEAVVYSRLGIAQAQVVTAEELSKAQKAELTRLLEQLTRKRVEARYELDPSLIGGAIVQIGSMIYDGSVREQLNRLRARLASE